ncbi:hypothetical protein [Nocardioides panaciterrulae]|uniref:Uncharacterized protein n=1 Tax=Nocardioides panaciterrulae TaxID=661492 RepID=A0A7Y9JBZ3_9ACTN|nr:hypothetical protein [Nocardioides panaciterrulae]NYD42878.1 hypothetical protein [Nocardioides panaciterrulae]
MRGLLFLVTAAIVLFAIDGGSVLLTKMSSPDDVRGAGYAAAAVAEKMPTNQQAAVVALHVAERDAESHGITVKDTSFVIYPGGKVTLTGTKTAPTILFHHFSWLAPLARVSTTVTVDPLPYVS